MRYILFDTEVYPEYFVIVMKEYEKEGVTVISSDDLSTLQKMINMLPLSQFVFTGVNIKGYDLPILEAILRNYKMYPKDPLRIAREVYNLSEGIIGSDLHARFSYNMCTFTDLLDDTVAGTSLKTFESNIGRPIEETKVPFGKRNLSSEEKQLIIGYCIEDVLGSEAMLKERWEYVQTKLHIADKFGLNRANALKRTIAGLSADVLVGNVYSRESPAFLNEPIRYTLHDTIRDYVHNNLPKWLVDRFTEYDENEGLVDRDFVMFDNMVTIGEGGAHSVHVKNGTNPNIVLTATPKLGKLLVIIDISSYYPNTAVTFDYQSRRVKDKAIFPRIIDEKNKLSPIAKGPNSTNEVRQALSTTKAIINATVGAFKQKNNNLFDPQQNVNVCFTGQLLILALANELYEKVGAVIPQVNTDGIILEFDEDKAPLVKSIIRSWERTTGLKFDANIVKRLWQRDVNNYVMELGNGKLKIKGRWFNPTLNPFNNLFFRVIKKAIFEYLVHGKSLATTIRDETNPLMFMYTVKTGPTFDGTVLSTARGDVTLGKVNRIYASKDRLHGGTLYKKQGTARKLVPDCPTIAKAYNTRVTDIPSDIDYDWYIERAQRLLDSLIRVEL